MRKHNQPSPHPQVSKRTQLKPWRFVLGRESLASALFKMAREGTSDELRQDIWLEVMPFGSELLRKTIIQKLKYG